jgi:hypothetical protein
MGIQYMDVYFDICMLLVTGLACIGVYLDTRSVYLFPPTSRCDFIHPNPSIRSCLLTAFLFPSSPSQSLVLHSVHSNHGIEVETCLTGTGGDTKIMSQGAIA